MNSTNHSPWATPRALLAIAGMAAALAACGGSDAKTSPTDTDSSTSSTTSAITTVGDIAAPPTNGDATSVCFPGGVVPPELDSTTDFFSSSGCTVTVADPGEAFWIGQGYHTVDAPYAVWVNDDLRCAVNNGMPGVGAGTTVWSVSCGSAFPADLDDPVPATTRTTEPPGDELAAQLWPAGLPLPADFIFQGVQDYPDRGFADFTLEYTGDGFAEESFWIWASEHFDNVDIADATGGRDMTYEGRHVEVAQMGDTLFRVILSN